MNIIFAFCTFDVAFELDSYQCAIVRIQKLRLLSSLKFKPRNARLGHIILCQSLWDRRRQGKPFLFHNSNAPLLILVLVLWGLRPCGDFNAWAPLLLNIQDASLDKLDDLWIAFGLIWCMTWHFQIRFKIHFETLLESFAKWLL